MSKSITLQIPDELYDQMQGAAQASDSSLEALAVELLSLLFQGAGQVDIDSLLAHMAYLSDDQLWSVVHRRLTPGQSERLHTLREKSQEQPLPPDETAELDALLEQVDRDMLLRSEAYLLLQKRGYNARQSA